jgi:guanine nucleotide-binding protein subunit alpha, other
MVTNPMWRCLKINKSRSSAKSDGSEIAKKMEKELAKRTCQFDNAVKILLLGAGESGKTTILKQMKILHMENGFTTQ